MKSKDVIEINICWKLYLLLRTAVISEGNNAGQSNKLSIAKQYNFAEHLGLTRFLRNNN